MRIKSRDLLLAQTRARIILEISIALVGVMLLVSALLANQRWLDHHFLPSFYTDRARYVFIESIVRIVIAAIGVTIASVVRRPLCKFITDRKSVV